MSDKRIVVPSCTKKTFLLTALIPAALVVFASCAGTFAVSSPRIIPDDYFGISPDRSPLEKEDFEILDSFGAVWIRTTPRWSNIEKIEGVWDFEPWDTYVEKAKAAGKKIVFILGFDNPRLYSNRKEHRDLTEKELPYFLLYVEQMARRYRGRVDAFEIWNEPNWLFWKGSNRHFFALALAAAKKIRETDPGAVILAGSTSRFDKGFTRGLFQSGVMAYTDGFSIHPYGVSPADSIRQIDALQKILDAYNYDKPVWVTEVGFATGGISFCRPERYAEYIVKNLGGLAVRNTRTAIWYELMDEYNPENVPDHWNFQHFWGLIYPNKILKQGARAYMLTTRYLRGAEYRPELPVRNRLPASVTSLYFRRNDEHTLLLWNDGGPRQVTLAIQGAAAVQSHDIESGETRTIGAETQMTLAKRPVFITWKTEQGFSGQGPVLSGKAP